MGCVSGKKKGHAENPVIRGPVSISAPDSNPKGTENLPRFTVGPYEIYEEIVRLPYGVICKGIHISSKVVRTIKIIDIKPSEGISLNPKHLETELKSLKSLDHPNIVKIHDMFVSGNKFYVAMDPCNGLMLIDYISSQTKITESLIGRILSQILAAVAYCHSKRVIHRDLNPKFIYVTQTDSNNINVKISEFGSSAFMDPENKLCGKMVPKDYTAPEVFENFYNEKCDLWSVGVIFHLLLAGTLPFTSMQVQNNSNEGLDLKTLKSRGFSDEALDLLSRFLEKDFRLRTTANEALEHPWIKKAVQGVDSSRDVRYALEELKKYKKVSDAQDLIKEFIASQIVCYDDSQSVIAAFQKIDANWDGRLSKEELLKHYKESMDEAVAQKIVQQIFETADRDKNGFIEYSEFVKASMKAQSLISFANIDKAFKLLDSDRNLKISSEELKFILEDSSDSNLFKLIKEADKNNDGEIDFGEFYDLIKKSYSS